MTPLGGSVAVARANPLSRLEVIMQTNSIQGKSIGVGEALRELAKDMRTFGVAGAVRGQGVGIAKAIVSVSLFHPKQASLQSFRQQFPLLRKRHKIIHKIIDLV